MKVIPMSNAWHTAAHDKHCPVAPGDCGLRHMVSVIQLYLLNTIGQVQSLSESPGSKLLQSQQI